MLAVGLVATGAAPGLADARQAEAVAHPLVFDQVTVVDVEQGKLLRAQRVVIVGNRIQTIGDVGAVELPQGAQVVNARGKYLIPGLWDLHVHALAYAQSLFLANGITGVRDASSSEPLGLLIRSRQEILAGTRVGPPRQILSGAAIDERKQCKRMSLTGHTCVAVGDSVGGRNLVDTLRAAGADMIKMYDLSRAMYFTLAAEARRLGIPFGGHLGGHLGRHPGVTVASVIEASDSGARIIDHVNSAGGLDTLCLGPQASLERCQPIAERFQQNGTWWVPTLTHRIIFNETIKPNPGPASDSIRTHFFEATKQFWSSSTPKGNWLRKAVKIPGTDSLRFLSLMQRVGLPILAGTDANGESRKEPPGFSLHAELAIYVTEGLTPLNALQAATLNPAKLLHATDSLGAVAPGKLADLVLLDADPLADITNTTTIRAVVANGRYYNRKVLNRLLADVRAKANQGRQARGKDDRRTMIDGDRALRGIVHR